MSLIGLPKVAVPLVSTCTCNSICVVVLEAKITAQDNADWAPTAAMRAAYASACRDLSSVLKAWRRVLTVSAPSMNGVLTQLGAPPIQVPRAGPSPQC